MLDTTALHQQVTLEEAAAWRRERGLPPVSDPPSRARLIAVLGILGSAGLGWLVAVETADLLEQSATSPTLIPVLAGASAAILTYWGASVPYRRRSRSEVPEGLAIRTERFLRDNDLEVGRALPPMAGMIAGYGDTRRIVQSISGRTAAGATGAEPAPFDVAVVDCVEQLGDKSLTSDFTYLAIPLERPMPHLVLDSTSNDGLLSSLPLAVDRNQILSLEGDFDRHFRLFCPAGYERDALLLFTPDLMAALLDHGAGFDVEVIDRHAYFFTTGSLDLSSAAVWDRFAAILRTISPKVTRVAGRYTGLRDERSIGGRRLRGGPRVPAWLYPAAIAAIVAVVGCGVQEFARLSG